MNDATGALPTRAAPSRREIRLRLKVQGAFTAAGSRARSPPDHCWTWARAAGPGQAPGMLGCARQGARSLGVHSNMERRQAGKSLIKAHGICCTTLEQSGVGARERQRWLRGQAARVPIPKGQRWHVLTEQPSQALLQASYI